MSQQFDGIADTEHLALPLLPESWLEDAWTRGMKSLGPFTVKGFWLGPGDHVEWDRRKARRLSRRSGVKFTTRPGYGRRVYWFNFQP